MKSFHILFVLLNPKYLPENAVVIRMMPNLPCLVQEGALLFARGSNAKQEDAALLRSLLHHCGLVEEGPEAWIDIHTGLSGSGVAFVSVPHVYDGVGMLEIFRDCVFLSPTLSPKNTLESMELLRS